MHVEKYTIPIERKNSPFTLALVADLHEHDPASVLAVLRKAKPDVIAVPGDLFERRHFSQNLFQIDKKSFSSILYSFIRPLDRMLDPLKRKLKRTSSENSYEFLREAARIAPIVMSFGNHEMYLTGKDSKVIHDNKIILLDNSSVEIGGILFGGIPSRLKSGHYDMDFLQEFGRDDRYKVLLCHHPEYFPQVSHYSDLVLAGHCHGGQMRVRGKGLFAPGQGFLPQYHHGIYTAKLKDRTARMVVSAGCSNTSFIPRIGNPEEVVLIRLM